ncbi:hypothetical protein TCAL_04037 [Tigriopus californicus]|uniref:Insulin receptor substrate 1 n=1 Tax=Tigriopus californicus TaxID=6832 RepID=A0A553PHI2_TIGCA|nr:insulin receptor substrate 1-B-like [Tigriopus californicus]TRY77140.1 hypothetical protein TCAL_04037 [Tigriopus californicus]|eukprot:TCALIF_04037-PA protein Name:"Similar to Irs1 Insulin receptor substrate 1 (Rattus norvegicus)" AED:0.06 eAED:0.06 QI:318/0.85/0.87/1/0.42/0.5/8/0/1122
MTEPQLPMTSMSGSSTPTGENPPIIEYFKRKKKMSWTEKKFNFPFISSNRSRSRTQHEYAKRDIEAQKVISASLRKLKKLQKRWFVLYSASEDGSHPAHLEYHENEKNWRDHKPPRNEYILDECLNICQRESRDQKFKYVIDVVSLHEFLSIVFEEELELKIWLDHLLSLQKGRSADGKIPKPNYDQVFPVQVKYFKAEDSSNTYLMSGPHRLCVTPEDLRFFPQGQLKPVIFRLESVRSHMCSDRMFHFQTGRSSPSGAGTLTLQCDDKDNAVTLNNAANHAMRNAKDVASSRQNSHAIRSRDHRHDISSTSLNTSSISEDIRRRSESLSKIDKSRAGTSMPKPSIQPTSYIEPSLQSRTRTISEGNHMESHRGGRTWGPSSMRGGGGKSVSLLSGSPLSPNQGSYVSSESAGSSNSIDEADYFHTRQTSVNDVPVTDTIFEESSAESCIDPAALRQMDSHLDYPIHSGGGATVSHQRTNSDHVMYTPVDIQSYPGDPRDPSSAIASFASSPLTNSEIQYASIMNAKATPTATADSDYMDMTPKSTAANSATSSLKRHTGTSSLLMEANITSPSSQSSYMPLDDNDDSAYHVMSPLGLPNNIINNTTTSQTTLTGSGANSSRSNSIILKDKPVIRDSNSSLPISSSRKASAVSSNTSNTNVITADISIKSAQSAPTATPTMTDGDDDYMAMSPVTSSSVASNISANQQSAPLSKLGHLNNINNNNNIFNTDTNNSNGVTNRTRKVDTSTLASASVNSTPMSGQLSRKNMDIPLKMQTTNSVNDIRTTNEYNNKFSPPEGDEPLQDYEVMSPVSVFRPLTEPLTSSAQPLRAIEEQLGGHNPGTPIHMRSEISGGARRKTSHSHVRSVERTGSKRNSFCSDVDGRWSPIDMPVIDRDALDAETPDYVPIDYSQSGTGIPIPIGPRMSPTSSNSVISGTPNSTESRFPDFNHDPTAGVPMIPPGQSKKAQSYIRQDDDDNNFDHPYHIPQRAYSISSGKGSSDLSSSGAVRVRTGSTSRFMDIPGRGSRSKLTPSPFGKTPPSAASGVPAGQSPNFISRIDSFFRNRTGSVPSKSNFIRRRRHRTQSEGEKDEDEDEDAEEDNHISNSNSSMRPGGSGARGNH